jgi:5-oxoprolinase (ATP-hydrolysing)
MRAVVSSEGQRLAERGWQFWIDRGGTFTDVVARRPDGRLTSLKLLSENPEQYGDAAIEGIDRVLGTAGYQAGDYAMVEAVKMGTTVATNALLERHGEPTALVITRGFRDALLIGYQQRPRLFDRHIVLPGALYARVIEADERVDRDGNVLESLDAGCLERDLLEAREHGIGSVAIVLMHGYRHHEHELAAAGIATAIGFEQVSVSHQVGALAKLVARGDTTVADAYLSPVLRRYVDRVAATLGDTRLLFMQSNGGLAEARSFRGRDSVLSGPAAGVVGMVGTALRAGYSRLIGFDMGGTSTDVSLYDGEFQRTLDSVVAGVRIQAPMMKIHTVAAAGRLRSRTPICAWEGSSPTSSRGSSARPPTSPSTRNRRRNALTASRPASSRRPAAHSMRRRSPRAACGSRWSGWRRPSSRSRFRRDTTSPISASAASAVRAASMPARWPTPWASSRY